MKKSIFLMVFVPGLAILLSCKTNEKVVSTKPDRVTAANEIDPDLPSGIDKFTFDLLQQMDTGEENLVFSPYSIVSALAMTGGGARRKTAEQLSNVLHFDISKDNTHQAFSDLQSQLESTLESNQTELVIANALWVQKDFALQDEYIQLCQSYYHAPVRNLSFTSPVNIEESRQLINQWVEDQTKNKIRDLIQPGMLSRLTRLVLTNAIYFNGNWEYPFDSSFTKEGTFNISDTRTTMVNYMWQHKQFFYFEDETLQAISLAYKGNKLAMLVVLPKQKQGEKLIKDLPMLKYDSIRANLKRTDIQLTLPKFKSESEIILNEILRQLGMVDAFNKDADFSGINGNRDLYIDFVVHKAFVEVNEQGTEAAAATGVGMALKGSMGSPVVFKADHPFWYFIYQKETGVILFSGRLAKP